MTKRIPSIPKGATGVYRSDCPTSPPRFKDGESIKVVKKGPVVHCIVTNGKGIEAIIRNSEIVLDEQCRASPPGESGVDWAAMQNDVNVRGQSPDS